MPKNSLFFRSLSLLLAIAVGFLSMPPAPVLAAMVTTDQVLAGATAEEAEGDRDRLRALLAREDVREELREMGLAPAEAAARVDAMSDGEVALLAGQMDSLAAGQAGAEGVLYWGAVLVLLLIILALVV